MANINPSPAATNAAIPSHRAPLPQFAARFLFFDASHLRFLILVTRSGTRAPSGFSADFLSTLSLSRIETPSFSDQSGLVVFSISTACRRKRYACVNRLWL